MGRQTNITLAAVQPITNISMPVFSVSHTGNNCTSKYTTLYVLPAQLLPLTTYLNVDGTFLYAVKSNEQVSTSNGCDKAYRMQ
jgi:hypothetical protein